MLRYLFFVKFFTNGFKHLNRKAQLYKYPINIPYNFISVYLKKKKCIYNSQQEIRLY